MKPGTRTINKTQANIGDMGFVRHVNCPNFYLAMVYRKCSSETSLIQHSMGPENDVRLWSVSYHIP